MILVTSGVQIASHRPMRRPFRGPLAHIRRNGQSPHPAHRPWPAQPAQPETCASVEGRLPRDRGGPRHILAGPWSRRGYHGPPVPALRRARACAHTYFQDRALESESAAHCAGKGVPGPSCGLPAAATVGAALAGQRRQSARAGEQEHMRLTGCRQAGGRFSGDG